MRPHQHRARLYAAELLDKHGPDAGNTNSVWLGLYECIRVCELKAVCEKYILENVGSCPRTEGSPYGP